MKKRKEHKCKSNYCTTLTLSTTIGINIITTGKFDFILEHGFRWRSCFFFNFFSFFFFCHLLILSLFAVVAFFLRHTMPPHRTAGYVLYTVHSLWRYKYFHRIIIIIKSNQMKRTAQCTLILRDKVKKRQKKSSERIKRNSIESNGSTYAPLSQVLQKFDSSSKWTIWTQKKQKKILKKYETYHHHHHWKVIVWRKKIHYESNVETQFGIYLHSNETKKDNFIRVYSCSELCFEFELTICLPIAYVWCMQKLRTNMTKRGESETND